MGSKWSSSKNADCRSFLKASILRIKTIKNPCLNFSWKFQKSVNIKRKSTFSPQEDAKLLSDDDNFSFLNLNIQFIFFSRWGSRFMFHLVVCSWKQTPTNFIKIKLNLKLFPLNISVCFSFLLLWHTCANVNELNWPHVYRQPALKNEPIFIVSIQPYRTDENIGFVEPFWSDFIDSMIIDSTFTTTQHHNLWQPKKISTGNPSISLSTF